MSIIAVGIRLLIELHGHPTVGPLLRRLERQATVAILRHLRTGRANFKSSRGERMS